MADLNLNSIMGMLSGGGVSAISKRTKLSQGDVANVLSAGVPILLTGMKRNSGTKAGEDSLRGALREHSEADLSNPGAFLKTADLKDGKKILGHVLGPDQASIVDRVSAASGVTKGKTTTILALVAPLLLSLLGGQQQQQGSGFNLLGMLGGLLGGGQQSSSGSLLGSLLGGGAQQTQSSSSGLQLLSNSSQQTQQAQQSGGLLDSLGGLGGLSGLFGGGQQESEPEPEEESQSSGLLDGFLNLFR